MESFFEALKNLGAGRLAIILLTFFGLIIFFIFIALRSNSPGMTLLYTNLSTADSTEIAAKLDISKIHYRLNEDGKQILVPQKDVGKARILLAQEGLPRQGSVGYEIFDKKQSFGTTSFVQNINKVRALEGELSRTITTIASVRSARVHLVLPQRELFSKDSNPATASVFLNLRNEAALGREQILGIQHLIAAAVPKLKASHVALIDQNGNMLARSDSGTGDGFGSSGAAEAKNAQETRLTRSIDNMLSRVVGFGKVRTSVSIDMNFDVINRNSESFDPEGQVIRSTQTTSEENVDNSSSSGNGNVSIQNNLPGLPDGGSNSSTVSADTNNRTEEVTNFEISKTIESIKRIGGKIQKISVAVLIDGRYEPDTTVQKPDDAPENWAPPKKYIPRTQEEIYKISKLVETAVGFDEARGDTLQVVNMQFIQEDVPESLSADDASIMGFQKADLLGLAQTVTLSIVAVLVILLVLRPLASHMVASSVRRSAAIREDSFADETAMLARGGAPAQLSAPSSMPAEPDEPSELEAMIDMSSVEGKVKASSVQKINELVTNHPGETVSVIRSWISQET